MLRRSVNCAFRVAMPLAGLALLTGCHMAVMDPKGPVGMQEKDLIILAVLLMLIPVVPVIFMTLWFAWRYRASNTKATYAPDFEHSNRIEAVVWAIPTLIIVALGAVTWVSTHQLDPKAAVPAAAGQADTRPIEVEVVSLDWKWLFIYPEYHIATVNEMALPVGRPVHFKLTSATVMNSFFIPQLGSQIYTMTGMETQLNLRADQAGSYDGISANYSGEGFAGMKFQAVATDQAGFDAWVAKAQASQAELDGNAYLALSQRGMTAKPVYYGTVQPELFHDILNACAPGSAGGPCTDTAMKMAMTKHIAPGVKDCAPKTEAVAAATAPATPRKS